VCESNCKLLVKLVGAETPKKRNIVEICTFSELRSKKRWVVLVKRQLTDASYHKGKLLETLTGAETHSDRAIRRKGMARKDEE